MQPEVAFVNLTAKPELRECFLKCKLPHQGLQLEHVVIESSDGQALATWPVEVNASIGPQVLRSKSGLGHIRSPIEKGSHANWEPMCAVS